MAIDPAQRIAELLKYDPAYEWRGGNAALIESREPEVILAGPSDTGKSWAACYKAHMACREYPGAQGALIRQVAADIPGSILVTMKRIIGSFPVEYYGGEKSPSQIIYPKVGTNPRSVIWIGGMDNPGKTLSAERDFVQISQAEQLKLDGYEILTRCTSGRGAVMPYTQVFGECNPGGAKNFLRQRERIRLLKSVHKDNPDLYDSAGNLTPQGKARIDALKAMTGVRHKRLFEGIWATAEGAVYDMFDSTPGGPHVRVRDPAEFKTWYLAIDEGYTHPAVILLIGVDSDGRWHVHREWYERGKLQAAIVAQALCWYKEYNCSLAAVDEAAAGLIADLRDVNVRARGGKGRVLDGIHAIQDRWKVQGDGLARLSVDPSCVNTINEAESYVWKPEKDEPVKENDHAMDPLRYLHDVVNTVHIGSPIAFVGE